MTMQRTKPWGGFKCPSDPAHGRLLDVGASERWSWYCPHTDHDGRLRSHPAGPSSGSRSHFTMVEAEKGSIA